MNQKNNYLIIYVKYISSLNTLQAIADLFGVCETTVHFIVKYVAEMICKHILTLNVQVSIRTHLKQYAENSKYFPSIKRELQAVCDSNLNVINVYC